MRLTGKGQITIPRLIRGARVSVASLNVLARDTRRYRTYSRN